MPNLPAELNPYAPPQDTFVAESAAELLKAVAQSYRVMGWVGLTLYLVVLPIPMLYHLTDNPPALTEAFLIATVLLLQSLFFYLMIRTADSIEVDLARVRKRVRWLGVLAAGFWFPWLTVPVVIAFRRLNRFDRIASLAQEANS